MEAFGDELNAASQQVGLGDDGEKEVPDQNQKKKKTKAKGFLELIFGWIIDPITAIINGIVSIVMFVVNTIKFCINLPWCAKWYVFALIGSILYLIPGTFFLVFGLQKVEKAIFKMRDQLDDMIVCNTGYTILRYSDVIRDGCYFQKKLKRNCGTTDFNPLKEVNDLFNDLFSDLSTFNFITVVNVLAIILFLGLVSFYFLKPKPQINLSEIADHIYT
jgi:hypothetical protein